MDETDNERPGITRTPSDLEHAMMRRGYTDDPLRQLVGRIEIPEELNITLSQRLTLVWTVITQLPAIIKGLAMKDARTLVAAILTIVTTVLAWMDIIIPPELASVILSLGSAVVGILMNGLGDIRSTVVGVLTGVTGLLAHFGMIIPPQWVEFILTTGVTLLTVLGINKHALTPTTK